MKRQVLLPVCIVVFIFLSFSLYHCGHKKPTDSSAQKETSADWVQLTADDLSREKKSKATPDRPGSQGNINNSDELPFIQPQDLPDSSDDDTINNLRQRLQEAAENNEKLHKQLTEEKTKNKKLSYQINGLHSRLSYQQKELHNVKSSLYNRNKSLENSSNNSINLPDQLKDKKRQLPANQKFSAKANPSTPSLQAEIDRLNDQVKGMKSRQAVMEESVKKAKLKAEAMLRYGQEKDRKLTQALKEIQNLRTKKLSTQKGNR